uniref:Flippase n=1 Tax=Geoglobus ahangari TaxID=113653 RepID=A0A7C4WE65_9EURY
MLAQKVLRNVIYNSSSVLIANVVGVIIAIYVARALKPELFGIYSLALSIAFLLLTFTDLGINATLIRYVAYAHWKRDYELVRGYVRGLSKLKILLALAVSLVLFISSDALSIYVFRKPLLSDPLKVTSLFILFYSLSGFVNAIFNAFNNFKANLVKSLVYELSRLFFVVLFILMGLSVVGALLGFVIASLLTLIALFALLLKSYSIPLFLGKIKSIEWKRIIRFTSYLTIGSITWVVFAYVDSVMIGMFLPAEDVGYYRASYNIVGAIAGLVSVPIVMFPVFVQLEGRDLKNAFNRAFKYSAILSFPVVFGLISLGEPLIRLVYGVDYLPAVPVLYILSFLILCSALGFWGVIFSAKEKPEYPVYVSFFAMILNIALNYFMILRWGIIGAGIATVISNFVSWIVLAYLSKIVLDVFPRMSHLIKPTVSSLIMFYFTSQFKLSRLVDGALVVLVGAAIYFVTLFLLRGITRDDLKYIGIVLGRS